MTTFFPSQDARISEIERQVEELKRRIFPPEAAAARTPLDLPAILLNNYSAGITNPATYITWGPPTDEPTKYFNLGGAFTWSSAAPTQIVAVVDCVVALTVFIEVASPTASEYYRMTVEGLTHLGAGDDTDAFTSATVGIPRLALYRTYIGRMQPATPVRVQVSQSPAGTHGLSDGSIAITRLRTW